MAYSDFTLLKIEQQFGIKNRRVSLFSEVTAQIEPTEQLVEMLKETEELSIKSEKARSEWIVVPVLRELRKRNDKFFTIYSGDMLNADVEKGLNGECDFILAKDTGSFDISYPIIQMVEAKRNDIEIGVHQCAAQLLGARIFNQTKGFELEKIYGCVTTGDEWFFMCLEKDLLIDTRKYHIRNLPELLGVLQNVVNYYKSVLN